MKRDGTGLPPEMREALRRVYRKLFKEKEEPMAKRKVKFNLTDGVKPERAGDGAIILRLSLPMNLAAGADRVISLGLSCDRPLIVYPAPNLTKRNVILMSGDGVRPSGTELKVSLHNAGKDTVLMERGDAVALCHVMDDSDVVLE